MPYADVFISNGNNSVVLQSTIHNWQWGVNS